MILESLQERREATGIHPGVIILVAVITGSLFNLRGTGLASAILRSSLRAQPHPPACGYSTGTPQPKQLPRKGHSPPPRRPATETFCATTTLGPSPVHRRVQDLALHTRTLVPALWPPGPCSQRPWDLSLLTSGCSLDQLHSPEDSHWPQDLLGISSSHE